MNIINNSNNSNIIQGGNDMTVNDTNILQEYIKKNKQFILLIVGKPCTNKSQLAKEFSEDLNLPLININKYYAPKVSLTPNKVHETVIDGVKFNLYDHPDNIDWSLLDDSINKHKENGVIIYGNYIDLDKLTITPDFSYFVNMNNNSCKTILIKNKLLPYSSTALTNEEIKLSRHGDDKDKEEVVKAVDNEEVVEAEEPIDNEEVVEAEEPIDKTEVVEAIDNEEPIDNEEVVKGTYDEEVVEDVGVVEVENVEEEFADSDVIETLGAAENADDAREQEQEGGGDKGGEEDGDKGDDTKGTFGEDDKKLDIYFTSIFLPMYEELSKKIKINKFYNIKSNTTFDEIYDDMFDLLMKLIEKNVYAEKNKFKEHKPTVSNSAKWDKGYKGNEGDKKDKGDKWDKVGKVDKESEGRYSKKDNKTAKSKKNDKSNITNKKNKSRKTKKKQDN